jgi:hypothetical protein
MAFAPRHRSSVARIGAGFKDRFNRLPEEARDAAGERKAGIELPGFNCVHGLTRGMDPRSSARLFETGNLEACGFTPDMACRMAPSLPEASIPGEIISSAYRLDA